MSVVFASEKPIKAASNHPPAKPGVSFMSRSKWLIGVANAAPAWEPPKGGVSVPETDLVVEKVVSGHCFTHPVFR